MAYRSDTVTLALEIPQQTLLAFDAAVNNGPAQAIRWLQIAVDARPIDGEMGPVTLRAVQATTAKVGVAAIGAEYLAQRLIFMAALPTWRTFGMGWARRLCRLPYQALTMRSDGQEIKPSVATPVV